jgi:hypothetical protein
MNITAKLLQIIRDGVVGWVFPKNFIHSLDKPNPVDPTRFLAALSMCESNGGLYRVPKYENSYGPGGSYYSKELYSKWGAWSCCSYSSFQIMYPTALELGYLGNPVELHLKDDVALTYVKKYFERRVFPKTIRPITIGDAADAYNSGTFLDANVPAKYVANFYMFYNELTLPEPEVKIDTPVPAPSVESTFGLQHP